MADEEHFEPDPAIDVVAAPDPVIGPLSVLEHVHDEAAGLYRVVVGHQVFAAAPEAEEGEDQMPPTQLIGYIGLKDYVFADDDDRWFHEDEFKDVVRKPPEDIVEEQRMLIKEALDAAEEIEDTPPPTEMPGSGTPL